MDEIRSDDATVDTIGLSGRSEVTSRMHVTGSPQKPKSSTKCVCPMMARLNALRIQQQLQGINHPDVLFALRHLARAHRRRGEAELADLLDEIIRGLEIVQSQENLACLQTLRISSQTF